MSYGINQSGNANSNTNNSSSSNLEAQWDKIQKRMDQAAMIKIEHQGTTTEHRSYLSAAENASTRNT